MTITAKYPSRCSSCGGAIAAGEKIEWSKGSPVRHTGCPTSAAPAASRSITVERVGRRSYLRGDTIHVRSLLRDGGCHWDADERAWWIGSQETAERLAGQARTAPTEAAPAKRITHCTAPNCGERLSDYAIQRGFRRCLDCVDGGGNAHGGMSYRDRHGNFVLGDDD